MSKCSIENCESKVKARGWCNKHYLRWSKHGSPNAEVTAKGGPIEDRFWPKVKFSMFCWEWQASRDSNGYGNFKLAGTSEPGHRVVWLLETGAMPEGLDIDHRCHNPPCVNPLHIRLATRKENSENKIAPPVNNSSGVAGVYWHKGSSKWLAQVRHNGNYHYVGRYATIEEAEQAVIAKRNELFTFNDKDRLP